MQSIVEKVQDRAITCAQQEAILYLEDGRHETARLSFGTLDARARLLAAIVQEANLSGTRILLLYPPGIDFSIALMGCWYAGAIAVPVHCPKIDEFAKHQALLQTIAADAEVSAVLTLEQFHSAAQSVFGLSPVLITTDTHVQPKQEYQLSAISADTIAYLQYTSGSTSTPKAAIITHGNLQHSLQQTIKSWHYTRKSVTVNWAPHTHVYGLVCGLLVPLYHGTPAVIMPPAVFINNPLVWLTALSRYKASHGGCPNFGYDLCVRAVNDEALSALDLRHWKVAVNGGDVVQEATLAAFVNKFSACGFTAQQFSSAYGMSEVTGAIAVSYGYAPHYAAAQRTLVGSGSLLKGLHAVVVDPETGLVRAEGEVGEIWVTGKSVAQGYWRRPEESKKVFQAQVADDERLYFRTGDLGFIRAGEIFLTGRLKEVMVVYGKKYYPLDFELSIANALRHYGTDYISVVFSMERAGKEEIIVVQELPESLFQEQGVAIEDAIRHAVTKEHGVEIYTILFSPPGSIPKTGSGKVQRKKTQQFFEEQTLAVYTAKPSTLAKEHTELDDKFIALVAQVLRLEPRQIEVDAPLSRYAFDSINIIQFVSLVNETYGLALSPATLYEYSSLAQFYNELIADTTTVEPQSKKQESEYSDRDIAIIGMSGMFPQADDVAAFWDNLYQGKDCIGEVPATRWNWHDRTVQWGGFIDHIDEFDADFFNISPREAELIDPQQRLFLQTVWKTIEDAGYASADLAAIKTGLFVGVFGHDYAEYLQKNEVMDAYLTTGIMNSMIANRISYILNLRGPSEAIDTACSSSLVAIHQAVHAILHGDCTLAIAGGVNILLTPTSFISAHQAGMLSADGRCKTFDKNANGYVRGEGVGAILLKKLSQAFADGDAIYGVIKGTAVNHGGHVNSLTAPNPNAQAEVIVNACQRAQVAIDCIDYIETHGTGTPLGDPIEINGLKKAFAQLAKEQNRAFLPEHYCGLGSVKTHIGHLESAAGIAGVIKVLLALRHEFFPANLHLTQLNPYIELDESPFYVMDEGRVWKRSATLRCAGISSFGFGGTNAHVIIQESPQILAPAATLKSNVYPIAISGKTERALRQRLYDLRDWLNQQEELPSLAALSFTLNKGRDHFQQRFFLMVESVQQLQDYLNQPGDILAAQPADPGQFGRDYLQGKNPDWHAFYGSYQQRIHLPAYPFAKEAHWLAVKKNEDTSKAVLVHEALSPAHTFGFRKQFTGNEFYFIEHKVGEEAVLPGAVSLEMARACASLVLDGTQAVSLRAVHWQKPIKGFEPLHINAYVQHEGISFVISSADQKEQYVRGALQPADRAHCVLMDLAELRRDVHQSLSHTEFYRQLEQTGMRYGSAFQVVQHLSFNAHSLWAELMLPQSVPMQNGEFVLHPCMLDGVLHVTHALMHNRQITYLPFSIEQMDIYHPLPAQCYVAARLVSAPEEQYAPVVAIQVFDAQENLIADIKGLTLCAISTEKNTVAYYHSLWVEKPVLKQSAPTSLLILGTNPEHTAAIQALVGGDIATSLTQQTTIAQTIVLALDSRLAADVAAYLEHTYYQVHALAKALIERKPSHPVEIICLSNRPSPVTRALSGFAKTLLQEQPAISCRCIEVHAVESLVNEFRQNDIQVRYDEHNTRYVRQYAPTHIYRPAEVFRTAAVYLITGGLGGLGYKVASWLAENYQARLVLTGRTSAAHIQHQMIRALEQKGAEVLYEAADSSCQEDVIALVNKSKTHFGVLNGIIHAAGVHDDAYIMHQNPAQMAAVLAPKVLGSYYLHEASRSDSLDFFILFSSVAAVFGNAGQSDYAYANAFLDEFALEREQQRAAGACFGRTVSINWPFWEDGGMTLSPTHLAWLQESLGIVPLSTEEGLSALQKAVAQEHAQCIVLPGMQSRLAATLAQRSVISSQSVGVAPPAAHENLYAHMEDFLRQLIATVLKCAPEHIESQRAFEHYGIDSLMILALNQQLEKEFSAVPKTLFFEYQNLADLTAYFVAHHADKFAAVAPRIVAQHSPEIRRDSAGDIAIIGVSGRYPEAKNLAEFWDNLRAGRDCIREVPAERWPVHDYFTADKDTAGKTYSKWGGFLTDADKFDPLFFTISPREAALMDPQERLFLETAWHTVEDAGYARETLAGQKVGVYVGVMYGQYQLFGAQGQFTPTNSFFASIANRVSYFFDFHGPSIALDTMCSSSLTAIHLACKSILDGECQLALAGGVNLSLHPNKYLLLSQGKFLASDGHCHSFGAGGDGYVPGEGVGAVLLKPLEHALADGDFIYAVIKGSQLNHGGKTNGYTVPNPNAQAELIASAYDKAGIDPAVVSYLEAHGTGTALGDPVEIAGLNKVFQREQRHAPCALGSVKSNIGHCESAAGIAAVSKVLLQLQHRTLVPSIGAARLNPHIDWEQTAFKVQQQTGEWHAVQGVRIAGISSFGAGGANAHLILAQAPDIEVSGHRAEPLSLFTLSAKTQAALVLRIRDLSSWIEHHPAASVADVAYTLNAGRSHFEWRCAFVASSLAALKSLLLHADSAFEANKLWIDDEAAATADLIHLAKQYLAKTAIDWQKIYHNKRHGRIPLPGYPFSKERYWYTDAQQAQEPESTTQPTALNDAVIAFLTQKVMQILQIRNHQIAVEQSLGDYGMDSVHFIELAKKIAEYYHLEFTPAVFYAHNSIMSIGEYLVGEWYEAVAAAHQIKAARPVSKAVVNTSVHSQDRGEDIAIIGMYAQLPQSADLDTFWQHISAGDDLITEVPPERWDWRQHSARSRSRWGGFIPNMDQFDAGFFNISAREAHLMDPQQRLFLETTWKTIEDGGYNPFELGTQKVGVFAGVEFSEYQTLIAAQQKEFHGYIATGNSHSMIANRVSYFFNFHGPSEAIDTACSSSLVAIHRAVHAIRYGECDLAIAGGVSLMLNPDTMTIISQLGALSPDGRCKTFDAAANGYVKGEGVGSVLLKPLHKAQADGDFIYAVIKSSAVNHGGKAQSLTAPNAHAQSELLIQAYSQARISPDTVTYIETHGTGTALGDPVEIEGLKQAFKALGVNKGSIALGSVKTNIGHLEPASGIAGVIKLVLAMKHEQMPGLVHLNTLNPYINLNNTPFYIPKATQAWQRIHDTAGNSVPLRAGISSFGFGGTNAHLILEEGRVHQGAASAVAQKPYYLITLSARKTESLQRKITELRQWIIKNKSVPLSSLSFTLNKGRAHFAHRCALVVGSSMELIEALTALEHQEIPPFCLVNAGQIHAMQGPVLDEAYQSAINGLSGLENKEQFRHKLFILADLYIKNYPLDWMRIYADEAVQRIAALPGYPFIKQRYWFDEQGQKPDVALTKSVVASDAPSAVIDYLRRIFAEKLQTVPEAISGDETYDVYGIDSVLGVEILLRLQQDFSTLPDTVLYEHTSLNALAKYLTEHYAHLLPAFVSDMPAAVNKPPLAALITDGLEASGYELAQSLVAQGTRMLLLTGEGNLSLATKEKNDRMSALRMQGIRVVYVAVDGADKANLDAAIAHAEQLWAQKIDSVFYADERTADNTIIAPKTIAINTEEERIASTANEIMAQPDSRWIAYCKRQTQAKIRLFCFPFGGGGALTYREWQAAFPDYIEVCPVQLPGRENRMDEQPIGSMDALISVLARTLRCEMDMPFAFFGHSFGALIAFELTRYLRRHQLPQPVHLFISAYPDPAVPSKGLQHLLRQLEEHDIHLLNLTAERIAQLKSSQLDILARVFRDNGIVDYGDVRMSKEIISVLLPVFIGDMNLVQSYSYASEQPLALSTSVFLGTQDTWVLPEDMRGWSRHSVLPCDFQHYESGHMFIREAEIRLQIIQKITEKLSEFSSVEAESLEV